MSAEPFRAGPHPGSETPGAFPPDDCRACARCCFADSALHVQVFAVDVERMGERARSFVDRSGGYGFMRFEDGHCVALACDPVTGLFGCSIYEERPDVCRSLERGTSGCRYEHGAKAGRPDVMLARLRGG